MGHDGTGFTVDPPSTVGLPWEVWPAWARAVALQGAPGQTCSNLLGVKAICLLKSPRSHLLSSRDMNPECLGSGSLSLLGTGSPDSLWREGGVRSVGLRGLNTGTGWFVECSGAELVEDGEAGAWRGRTDHRPVCRPRRWRPPAALLSSSPQWPSSPRHRARRHRAVKPSSSRLTDPGWKRPI